MSLLKFLLRIFLSLVVVCMQAEVKANDEELSKFLEKVNNRLAELNDEYNSADWEREKSGSVDRSNLDQAEKNKADYLKSISPDVVKYIQQSVGSPDLQRQLHYIPLDFQVLPQEQFEAITALKISSAESFQKIQLCSYEDRKMCNLSYVGHAFPAMLQSSDPKEIEFYFTQFKDKAAKEVRENFLKFATLYREAAKLSGFSNAADFWYRKYGKTSSTALESLDQIVKSLRPLYEQAHAYFRGQLRSKYGPEIIEPNMPISDALFNMETNKLRHNVHGTADLPHSTTQSPNITDALLMRGMTQKDVFEAAHKFFTSLGMPQLEGSFWQDKCTQAVDRSLIERDIKVYKFYGQNSIKLTYTPAVEEKTFYLMYDALTFVYYRQAFANQPILYQKSPINDYMETALANFFSLASSSPKYLESIGIKQFDYTSEQARINGLFRKGLKDIFDLHTYYVADRLRVEFITGKMDINDNCASVSFMEKHQGIQPSSIRSKNDFDAVISFLLSFDMQFGALVYITAFKYQLFEHFCLLTGEYKKNDPTKPLDLCDLSGHPEVGEAIYKAMSLGVSADFKEFLKTLVGKEELDISGFLEYYRPLHEWLEKENKQKSYEVGWKSVNKCQ